MPALARPQNDEYDAYCQNYLDMVPANVTNILEHLKRQGLEVLTLLRTLDDEQGSYCYEPGKWSVKEVVGHLIDTERLFVFRALWLARGAVLAQPAMDQDLWAGNSNAGQRTMAELWREQHVCRTDHLYLLKGLDDAATGRSGIVAGSNCSVRAIPWIVAGHERHHLNILRDRYGIG